MHCISLAILSRLNQFLSPAVGTNRPFCVDMLLNNKAINKQNNSGFNFDIEFVFYYGLIFI